MTLRTKHVEKDAQMDWRLPQGAQAYKFALKLFTTTDYSPQYIHNLGLQEVDRIQAEMLVSTFNIRPKAGMEVVRIPEFKEKTSPGAYYQPPALDGSRPGRFFTNLYDAVLKNGAMPLDLLEQVIDSYIAREVGTEDEDEVVVKL